MFSMLLSAVPAQITGSVDMQGIENLGNYVEKTLEGCFCLAGRGLVASLALMIAPVGNVPQTTSKLAVASSASLVCISPGSQTDIAPATSISDRFWAGFLPTPTDTTAPTLVPTNTGALKIFKRKNDV